MKLERHSKANQTKHAKKNLISNDEDSKDSSDDEPDNHTHKSRQITYRNIRHYLSQMRTRHVDNMPERKHHAYYGKTCSDSGASVTMTPNVNLVSNFVPSTEKIYLPNGDVIYTIGKGMLGPLTDVLVAPDLEDTLVSVSQFDKLGYSTLYGNDQVKIFEGYALDDDSELIAVGQRLNDNLYFFDKDEDFLPKKNHLRVITRTGAGESRNDHPNNLQLEEKKRKLIYLDPVIHQSTKRNTITSDEVIVDLNDHKNSTLNDSDHDNDEENNVIENETLVYEPERINSRSSKQSKLDDLHYITGLSKKKLVEALQHNAFTGITLTGEQCKGLNMTNSDAYYEGHYKAKSLPRINDMDTRSPCDVIAGDILAKFKVPNKKKEQYAFLFIDHESSMLFPFFGKSKSEFADSLSDLKVDVIDKTDYTWKVLQTDDEKSTTRGRVKQFCRDHKIVQHISAPYKHGQNGMIERAVGMVQDLAATLMFQFNAPDQYYFNAIKQACYILKTCRIPKGSYSI